MLRPLIFVISLRHLVAPPPLPIPGRALPTHYPGPKAVVGHRAVRPLRQEVPRLQPDCVSTPMRTLACIIAVLTKLRAKGPYGVMYSKRSLLSHSLLTGSSSSPTSRSLTLLTASPYYPPIFILSDLLQLVRLPLYYPVCGVQL